MKALLAPYLIWIALAGGLLVGGVGVGWFQEGRIDRAKTKAIEERSARLQAEAVLNQLRASNKELQETIRQQNQAVTDLAKASEEGQKTAVAALEKARTSNRATAQTIAALTAKIAAGTGANCADAIAEVRAGL